MFHISRIWRPVIIGCFHHWKGFCEVSNCQSYAEVLHFIRLSEYAKTILQKLTERMQKCPENHKHYFKKQPTLLLESDDEESMSE